MTSPDGIIALFEKGAGAHTMLEGPPTDDSILAIKETLLNTVFQIRFEGTNAGDPSGAILPEDKYMDVNDTEVPYDRQLDARPSYDPNLRDDDPARRSKEAAWLAGTRNQERKRAIDRGAIAFLQVVIPDTYLRPLKHPDSFYTKVTCIAMLQQLETSSGGLERVDLVAELFNFFTRWEQDPRIPEFLVHLKDLQKKSVRGGLPFSGDLLTGIGSKSLLTYNCFPMDRPKWDSLPPVEQTLDAFEKFFTPLHVAMEREARMSTGADGAGVFGTAASAIRAHGITPIPGAVAGSAGAPGRDPSPPDQIDAAFTALAAAAAASSHVQETLATAATTQYSAILAEITALKALYVAPSAAGGGGGGGGRGGTSATDIARRSKDNLRINQLQSAIKFKWVTGPGASFCSTHGWGLAADHNSMRCRNKTREGEPGGHVNSATRANPSGPGKTKNKGWDDFL